MTAKGPHSIPKHVRNKSENRPKCLPNRSQILQKTTKNTIKNHSRSHPESNPVPSGSDSRTGSASQPIGLIPSQQIGSPRISYVSKLEKKTHRNNLVAEKAFGLFFRSKKHFSEKQALCLCGTCPQGLFFSEKNDFSIMMCLDVFLLIFEEQDDTTTTRRRHDDTTTRKLLILSRPRSHRTQGSNTP